MKNILFFTILATLASFISFACTTNISTPLTPAQVPHTPTATFTATALLSATATKTATATSQGTATATGTATITATPTSTTTRLPTETPTFTFTVTGTLTVIATPTCYTYTRMFAQGGSAEACVIDGSGNAYVSNLFSGTIVKYDSTGTVITQWGSVGSGPGQFNSPRSLALNSAGTTLFVADETNNRIQTFTNNGTFINQWGTYSTTIAPGNFHYPHGVAVDLNNVVYVSDDNRIQKYTSDGTYISTWANFDGAIALAVNAAGTTVYSCQSPNPGTIKAYSPSGTILTQWTTPDQYATGIGLDPAGNVIVADDTYIDKFSPNGNLICQVAFVTSAGIVATSSTGVLLYSPYNVATDSTGSIYDISTRAIQVFN